MEGRGQECFTEPRHSHYLMYHVWWMAETHAPELDWTDDEGIVVGREALGAKATVTHSQT
jgi:hypothetical protein